MRLYPPAWVIGREAIEPVDVAGIRVEPGAQLILPTWVVHRDECIGNAFAKMEATLALATILQRTRLRFPPQPEPELVPTVTLRPKRPIRAVVSV
jgi:cytochrome P450